MSENYPGIIERHTGVECPRPLTRCLICHDTAAGGEETANEVFADTLRDLGLSGGKAPRELASALEDLPADQDSDGDGVSDQEEIAACNNPSGGELSEGPGYGCNGARFAAHAPELDGWALAAAFALCLALRLRRGGAARATLLLLMLIALEPLPACSPSKILEQSFPAKVRTCYEFPAPTDGGVSPQTSFYGDVARPEGCDAVSGAGGSSGSGGSSNGAAGTSGSGGSSTSSNGGSASTSGSGGSSSEPGDAGGHSDDAPDAGQGGSAPVEPPLSAACRALGEARGFSDFGDDTAVMLALFRASFEVGGCQDAENGQCHEPGGNQPNLRDGDVLARLLDGRTDPEPEEYKCALLLPEERVWITRGAGLESSLLWRKLHSAPSDAPFLDLPEPPCGDSMPAFPGEPSALSETDRQCVAGWIAKVSGNGGP